MKDQPEALRLAEWFEGGLGGCELEAAAELRRLSAEHEEDQRVIAVWRGRTQRAEAQRDALLEALKDAMQWFSRLQDWSGTGDPNLEMYRAAIAAVEEKT